MLFQPDQIEDLESIKKKKVKIYNLRNSFILSLTGMWNHALSLAFISKTGIASLITRLFRRLGKYSNVSVRWISYSFQAAAESKPSCPFACITYS